MFEIGAVIKIFAEETTPPKVKYCIIVGNASSEIATIFINSDLRISYLGELQGLQYPLDSNDLSFLSHQSYADCSEICERSKAVLNQILQKEPGRKVGKLNQRKTEEILALLKKAKTIATGEKKKYGLQ